MILNETRYEAIGLGAVVNGSVFFGAGYLYGTLSGTNPWLAAQALAIYALANTALNVIVDVTTGGKEVSPKLFYAALIVEEGLLGVLQIFALRHFQLIAFYGTHACATCLYARTLYHLNELIKYE